MEKVVLEIFTEERSMENFLRGLLPRILPSDFQLDINCFIRPHEGKSDLKKSLIRKVKAFQNYPHPVKLLIIHDQDSNDCKLLKADLVSICSSISNLEFLVRIACKELENWYLGDLYSIERIYPDSRASRLSNKSKFKRPDSLNGTEELENLSKKFSKSHASREIGKIICLEDNRSVSFNHFVSGVSKILISSTG